MTGADLPRRAEVARAYDLGVEAYVNVWSPVITPPARAVVAALALQPGARVLDIGTGAGALVPSIRAAAADVIAFGVDPSREMLLAATRTTALPAVQGDAMALPLRAGVADAALLAFVLFHLPDPAAGMAEVARVLADEGCVGTVTWIHETTVPAYNVWSETLTDAGAPPLPATRVDTGLNDAAGLERLFASAGLEATRVWSEDLQRQWDQSSYWALAMTSGLNRRRLRQLDRESRDTVLERARERLYALPPEAFAWSGEVLCAVATKVRPGR